MLRSLVSWIVFIVVMTVMVISATVFVTFLYFPFVALKALYLAASGRIHEATGPKPGAPKTGAGASN